jgi:hypothetical protein
MFDRIFAPVLAFLMLLAATLTVAAGFFPGARSVAVEAASDTPAPPMLEPVLIHIKRADALRRLQEEDSRQHSSGALQGRDEALHPTRH